MYQLIASVVLVLSYLGVISIGCILAGITTFFDGGPLWFALAGMLLGVLGLLNAHYHLSVAIHMAEEDAVKNAMSSCLRAAVKYQEVIE